MRPYSLDLRTRIVDAYKAGNASPMQLAERFGVCLATVYNYLKRQKTNKELSPKRRSPSLRRPTNDPAVQKIVVELVREDNHATLAEYCERLAQRCKVQLSVPSMCLLLKNLRFRRKKNGARFRTRASSSSAGA